MVWRNGLEKWADRKLMKFNEKCEFLDLGRNNAMHKCRLGAAKLENSFAETALSILVDIKLNMTQQVPLPQEVKGSWYFGLH